jgi:hypothetical protein
MNVKIPVNNYVEYYDGDKSHHRAFFHAVLERLCKYEPESLQPGGDLRDLWVAAVETKAPMLPPGSTTPPQGALGWALMVELAEQAGAKFPELVAAQGALESGWYKHTSGENNFFGLKGAGLIKETREFVNGKWITKKESFMNFGTPKECIVYLVDKWYKDFSGYKGVNNAANRDEAARMLVKEGYATDPQYAEKLIKLMNENAPIASGAPSLELQQPNKNPIVIAGAVGPKKTPWDFNFKNGDSHIVVNDINETAKAFNYQGKLLWEVKALGRGQGGEKEYNRLGTDTPPGIYEIGQIYKDYERVGSSPAFDRTLILLI